jgi:hypothetical protein
MLFAHYFLAFPDSLFSLKFSHVLLFLAVQWWMSWWMLDTVEAIGWVSYLLTCTSCRYILKVESSSPCLVRLSISICTRRQHGHEAMSFAVNFSHCDAYLIWNLLVTSLLLSYEPPLLWLFDRRKEWVDYVFWRHIHEKFHFAYLWIPFTTLLQSGLLSSQKRACEFWNPTNTSLAYTYIVICYLFSVTVDVHATWSTAVSIFALMSFSCLWCALFSFGVVSDLCSGSFQKFDGRSSWIT